jgi:hypothetical protein
VAPPPPHGSRGCVATIRRLMQGVGHTVPCNTSRQAAAGSVGGLGGHLGAVLCHKRLQLYVHLRPCLNSAETLLKFTEISVCLRFLAGVHVFEAAEIQIREQIHDPCLLLDSAPRDYEC